MSLIDPLGCCLAASWSTCGNDDPSLKLDGLSPQGNAVDKSIVV